MAPWMNKISPLSLLALLITVKHSKEDCHHYFQFDDLKTNLMENIMLIKTKDPKDQLECSLGRKCPDNELFCFVLDHCLGVEEGKGIHPKCDGESDQSVSYYIFMCKMAAHLNLSTDACQGFDVVCPSSPHHSTTIATPTTLPERTAAPLEPNATSVQPSTSTGATSTNAHGSNDGHISNNNSTVNSGWFRAFLLSVTVCLGLAALCLYTWRRNRQLSETIRTLRMVNELQLVAPRADANGNESAVLIQPETPVNVMNGSLQ